MPEPVEIRKFQNIQFRAPQQFDNGAIPLAAFREIPRDIRLRGRLGAARQIGDGRKCGGIAQLGLIPFAEDISLRRERVEEDMNLMTPPQQFIGDPKMKHARAAPRDRE